MIRKLVYTGVISLFATTAANAGNMNNITDRLYISGAGGIESISDADLKGPAITDTEIDLDTGWLGLGALGYQHDPNWRAELELGYSSNDVDSALGATAASGDVTTTSALVNVLYDILPNSVINPHIGAGIGVVNTNVDASTTIGGGTTVVDDSSLNPAAQGIIGLSYAINNQLEAFTSYRYITALGDVDDLKTTTGLDVESDYDSNRVIVGLKYAFAPKGKAPKRSSWSFGKKRSYNVFFDFNDDNLTPAAKKVLRNISKEVARGNSARINVTGHTDRSGPDAYNQDLSERRARAVRAELVRLGVSGKKILTNAEGESDPLVSTKDGVSEAQNRRVEIVYR